MADENHFRKFWELGFRPLVPIVPPGAPINPRSSLAKRPGSAGKVPGLKGSDGLWSSFAWPQCVATEADLDIWHSIGAGVGIKTGAGLAAIDVDVTDRALGEQIVRVLAKFELAVCKFRVGNKPKFLIPIRITEEVHYTRVEFGKERVELLCDGRQFVAWGVHPATGRGYEWPKGVPAFDELPVLDEDRIKELFDALAKLPGASRMARQGPSADRSLIDQRTLAAPLEAVRKVMAALPNKFDDRETYVRVGMALKAALPGSPDEAFDLWCDWGERWDGGHNDLETMDGDFRSFKPPFKLGFPYLVNLAAKYGGLDPAHAWFQEQDDDPKAAMDDELPWWDAGRWRDAPIPERRWIVKNMIPDGEVTLLMGSGGVGKTLLAQQMATCVAMGLPFFGREVTQCKVMLFAGEDSLDELHIRQRQICAGLGLDIGELENLRVLSRKFMDNIFMLWDRNKAAPEKQKIWRQLVADAKRWGARFIIVDTIADTFGGSEIDRQQVRQFVQMVLGRLAEEIGGAVLALGHPSRAGEASGEGTSGSTAWHASVRSRFYMEYAASGESSDFRRLVNKKANYAAAGDSMLLRWNRGCFDLVSSQSRNAEIGGVPKTTDVVESALLEAVAQATASGTQLSAARNSPRYAPKILKQRAPELLGHHTMSEIEGALDRLLSHGRIVETADRRGPYRNKVVTLCVNSGQNIFD